LQRGGIEPVRVVKRAQVLRLLDQGIGPPQVASAVGPNLDSDGLISAPAVT